MFAILRTQCSESGLDLDEVLNVYSGSSTSAGGNSSAGSSMSAKKRRSEDNWGEQSSWGSRDNWNESGWNASAWSESSGQQAQDNLLVVMGIHVPRLFFFMFRCLGYVFQTTSREVCMTLELELIMES